MMSTKDYQLLVLEKNEAIERYKQSQLLIEKLEEELKNLKEISPNGEKYFLNVLQNEYLQIIDSLREKLKTLREKLDNELQNGHGKEREIKILNDKIENLRDKFNNSEKELFNTKQLLEQEQGKILQLENELISSGKELYYLKNKHQYVNTIEEERDKLQHENILLSKDCNELELALEVCHQKIDSYEQELNRLNDDLRLLIREKDTISKKNTNFQEEVIELKDKILNLSSECKKVNENTQNLLDEKIEIHEEFKFMKNYTMTNRGSELNFFDQASGSVLELCKSVNKLKKIVHEYDQTNKELRSKVNSYQLRVKKYQNRILKMDHIISFFQQNLIALQKKLQVITNRWQHETSEIILKMQNRIQELNEKYQTTKQENAMMKKYWKERRSGAKVDETVG